MTSISVVKICYVFIIVINKCNENSIYSSLDLSLTNSSKQQLEISFACVFCMQSRWISLRHAVN